MYWERNKPFAFNFLENTTILLRVLQRNYIYLCIKIYCKELAHAFWKLRSPKICSQEAGSLETQESELCSSSPRPENQESQWCMFQTDSQQPRDPERGQYFSLSPNARRDQCPSSKQWGRRVHSLLLISYWGGFSLLILFRSSIDWIEPSALEGNLLYSVYWFTC